MKKHSGSFLTDRYVAHRGLFNNTDIPENSLPAFKKAVENGFGIEMDVQMTSDGRLVVFHDDALKRMTGSDGDIREKTFEQIRTLKLLDTECLIPTFDEFLETVDGKTPLVIEIKSHKKIGTAESKLYERLKSYKGDFCVESFNPFIVRWFKVHAPEIIRGQLSCSHETSKLPFFVRNMLRNLSFCKWNGSQFVAYDAIDIANNKHVAKLREKLPVICWTVKSQKQLDDLSDYYDNIIFDSFVPVRDDKAMQAK